MPIEDADAQHIVTLSVNAANGSMFSQDEDDLFTAGSTVNVTVTPNGENSVRGIVVTAEDGTKVDCALQGRVYPTEAGKTVYTINSPVIYQFTMPAQAVTVAAEFWDKDSVLRGCTPIDQNNFPDNAFRGYVLEYLDTNGDGLLSNEEIENTPDIALRKATLVSEFGTTTPVSLEGIQRFYALEILDLDGNDWIAELDVWSTTIPRRTCSPAR